MTEDEFVSAVKRYVRDSAIKGVIKTLEKPSGRSPVEAQVQLSNWFNKLKKSDRDYVQLAVSEGADAALFGLFCVFDGVLLIDEKFRDGRLQITIEQDGAVTVISDNQKISSLHDLYNSDVGLKNE